MIHTQLVRIVYTKNISTTSQCIFFVRNTILVDEDRFQLKFSSSLCTYRQYTIILGNGITAYNDIHITGNTQIAQCKQVSCFRFSSEITFFVWSSRNQDVFVINLTTLIPVSDRNDCLTVFVHHFVSVVVQDFTSFLIIDVGISSKVCRFYINIPFCSRHVFEVHLTLVSRNNLRQITIQVKHQTCIIFLSVLAVDDIHEIQTFLNIRRMRSRSDVQTDTVIDCIEVRAFQVFRRTDSSFTTSAT